MEVSTRAISFLSLPLSLTSLDLPPSPLKWLCRRFSRRSESFFFSSAPDKLFIFSFFLSWVIVNILLFFRNSRNNFGFQGQFGTRFAQRLASNMFLHAIHFKYNPSGQNRKAVALWVALAFTHADFRGFLGIGPVREDAYPVLAGFGQRVGVPLAGRFKLFGPDSASRLGFQTERAEGQLGATSGRGRLFGIGTPGLPFSEFYFFG